MIGLLKILLIAAWWIGIPVVAVMAASADPSNGEGWAAFVFVLKLLEMVVLFASAIGSHLAQGGSFRE